MKKVYRYDRETGQVILTRIESGGVSDVYFKEPYYDPNIMDEKDSTTWDKGTFVKSREHKAILLKKHGLRESGDRIKGSRSFDPIAHKYALKQKGG